MRCDTICKFRNFCWFFYEYCARICYEKLKKSCIARVCLLGYFLKFHKTGTVCLSRGGIRLCRRAFLRLATESKTLFLPVLIIITHALVGKWRRIAYYPEDLLPVCSVYLLNGVGYLVFFGKMIDCQFGNDIRADDWETVRISTTGLQSTYRLPMSFSLAGRIDRRSRCNCMFLRN